MRLRFTALSVLLGIILDLFHCIMFVKSKSLTLRFSIYLFRFVVMYLILPETEGRSLEDIELHFSDNTKQFTDIDIHKNTNTQNHTLNVNSHSK